MFKAEYIIYVYLLITIMIILFNLWYAIHEKYTKKRGNKKFNLYKEKIENQEYTKKKEMIKNEEHLQFLKKELKRTNHLLVFQDVLSYFQKENLNTLEKYVKTYEEIFSFLLRKYKEKDSMHKAYFAKFLSEFSPTSLKKEEMEEELLTFVKDSSIYCRENAMLYLYQRATSKTIAKALLTISENNLYYNKKLLTNDLLKYQGKEEELIENLFVVFEHLQEDMQVAIINYVRYTKVDLNKKLRKMLESNQYSEEVNLAIIRYFGKHLYPDVLPYLLKKMEDKSIENLASRIIIVQIIGNYKTKEAKEVLLDAISDANWYIRKNASVTLSHMELTKTEKEKIKKKAEKDRFAKEMIAYCFQEEKEGK